MKKAIFIDGNSLLHRAFYALPPTMKTKDGRYTNAVYGFLNMLFTLNENYSPDYLAVAFDIKKKTFRNELYSEYKAGRKPTPFELKEQFPLIRETLNTLNVPYLELLGFEGDDILGTLSKKAEEENIFSYIVTGDKDSLQLIDENCHVLLTKKGVSELEEYSIEHLREVYGLEPFQIVDLKALMGDASDNIPGIAGIGEKTALKLLTSYQTIEKLYENIDSLAKNKLLEKLINGKNSAFLSKSLATIKRDIPVDCTVEALAFNGFEEENLRNCLTNLEFFSMLKRFGIIQKKEIEKKQETILIKTAEDLKVVKDKNPDPEYFSFFAEGDSYFFYLNENEYEARVTRELFGSRLSDEELFCELKTYFENTNVKKYLCGAKELKHFLFGFNVEILGEVFDVALAQYVLNPTGKRLKLEELSSDYAASGKALAIYEIALKEEKLIKEKELSYIFYNVETPLTEVLFSMENEGFTVDRAKLKELSADYSLKIDELTENIYECAGEPFNIGSPKQLGEILFNKLMLPAKKKTKTGFSTNAEVLEDLIDKHPIIPLILEYRALTKMKSTYIDGFLNVTSDKDAKIHSTFNQTVTATGRISSTEPNLQNIPARSELSNDIRRVFIPSKPNNIIISADYSQIELRVLAHIAQDKHMIDAFLKGEDIHKRTASEVFEVPQDKVTKQMRSAAKAVNFGIVYGISDFGLAKNLGIPRFKAAEYINKYLIEFSGVAQYMKNIVAQAKKDGYVRTLFGRIRYIEELDSSNYNTRSFGERAAMNTPIQGSAADIIKIAMIGVYNALKNENLKSQLILQVHDELVIDAYPEEEAAVKRILKEQMKDRFSLSVPLDIDIETGKTF